MKALLKQFYDLEPVVADGLLMQARCKAMIAGAWIQGQFIPLEKGIKGMTLQIHDWVNSYAQAS